jgi:hypothetical protein
MRTETGQQHHGPGMCGSGNLQRLAQRAADRFERPQQFAQQQLPARTAGIIGTRFGRQRPAPGQFLAVDECGVFER